MVFVNLFIFAVTVSADSVLKGQCRLDPHPSVEYWCVDPGTDGGSRLCRDHEPAGTRVDPKCRTNYYSPSDLTYMRCLGGYWDYTAKCLPDCGRVTPDGMGLAVGGERVRRGVLPWHAGIYTKTVQRNTTLYEYQQVCGGTLISSKVVISAAHCFWTALEKQLPASQFAVAVGKLYRPWGDPVDQAQKSDVSAIHLPPRYKGATTNYQDDIAVLVVTREFQHDNYVRPVCLSFNYFFEAQQLHSGNHGKVAGWGLTAANGKASSVLLVVELPYVEVGICFSDSPFSFQQYITSDKICAGTLQHNTALCRGDSGGGLVFSSSTMGIERYYLRGVVSTAPTSDDLCNTASYTTFTQLTKHEKFIKQYWIESGEFHCQDGSFIASGTQCDGARDCADGSDETEDACAAQTCAEGLFRCAYGACVDRGAECNGVRDCADGSDEAAALCGEITTNKPEAVSCILPPYPEHGAYTTDIVGAEPGQGYERVSVSNVTCERGYDALGYASREFSCSHGVWTGSVPKCVSICGSSLAHDNVSGYEFSNHTAHCYKIHGQAASWANANRTCVAEGARLAVANSAAEERVLVELRQRYPLNAIHGAYVTIDVYVGIYWSGEWRTVDGQTLAQAGHVNWARGKPWTGDKYPYGAMHSYGTLSNWDGLYKLAFICEMA